MKQTFSEVAIVLFCSLALLFLADCTPTKVIRTLRTHDQADTIIPSQSAVKVHMKDGSLYVLSGLNLHQTNDILVGFGYYYDANRNAINPSYRSQSNFLAGQQTYRIEFADVALVETNTIAGVSGKLLAMSLIGVPSVLTSIYCLTNPKACFGSCPTFYAWNGETMKLMAEGFSSSILRAFEKSDVDMLYGAKTRGNDFQLKLTNEALETHVIRYADLLVFPKKGQERVFATEDDQFYQTGNILSPSQCLAPEGDCRSLIEQMDAKERYTEADSKNLAAREYIEIEFNAASKEQTGLIIGARQTLLTTYLFYQTLANLGNNAGCFASRIESGDRSLKKKVDKIWDLLGGIEVFVENRSGKWIKAGEVAEMGPIASDVHLIALPDQESELIKVRLKMTKGLWRIDYVGLAERIEPVQPVHINPSLVLTNDTIDNIALSKLCDSGEPLITLPGDSHTLHYTLPGNSNNYELFLKSKGYYLEWMREEWIAEQNLKKAYLMFGMPRLYLKLVADKFKVVEPTMEENFWRSRYVKN